MMKAFILIEKLSSEDASFISLGIRFQFLTPETLRDCLPISVLNVGIDRALFELSLVQYLC